VGPPQAAMAPQQYGLATDRDVQFGDLTEKNIGQLRLLNEALYPVNYQDKFYKDVLNQGELAQYVYFRDLLVGAICARVEPQDDMTFKMYILTLGVLEPYRRLGIGSRMVDYIVGKAREQPDVKEIYLHVQVGNDSAVDFYRKHGFEQGESIPDYYKKITPTEARVFRKAL